jgi:hypothetical protein
MLQGGILMGDIFAEQLVKRKKKPSEQFLKYALTALVVVFALGGLFVAGFLVYLALALAVACYFIFPRFNVEYEYSYVNGEFDVDVIYSMQKRKKKEAFNLQDVDCVALYGNPALAAYQTGYTITDYSAFDASKPPYVIVKGSEKRLIYMQIEDPTILSDMKRRMQRRFYEN